MLSLLLKSIFIGICAILPGVSGSTFAITLGIYQIILDIVFNKQIKNNIHILIIIFISFIFGIYLSYFLLIYMLKYKTILYYILSAILINDTSLMIKNLYKKNYKIKIFPLILPIIISLLLNNFKLHINSLKYFFGGILFMFGKIFPGVSSSFFLINLGIYEDILILLIKPILLISKFKLYFPFIIGIIIGLLVFLKLINYLLKNKYEFTYNMILGLIISSIFILLPKFLFDLEHIIGISLMFVILFILYKIKK